VSRRMTSSEATDMIETVFETGVEAVFTGIVEAFIGDIDVGRARADIESYLAIVGESIDTDTIEVSPDQSDDPIGVDCVRICIRTEC
jgi:hypothetical protein